MQGSERVNFEGRLCLAVEAICKGQFKSVRKAAAAYEVPRTTLQYRLHDRLPQHDYRPSAHQLTPTEEETLIQYILDQDSQGFPLRVAIVGETANLLRAARATPTTTPVGKNWATNFINRSPQLRAAYTRRLDYQRAKCEDPKLIGDWFRLVYNMTAKYGILREDTYNFDETGFSMGLISTSKVVTGAERRGRPKAKQPGNREWVTAVHCINTEGWQIPPMIILKGKEHQASWYQIPGLPTSWQLSVSENGWINDSLAVDWIKHFNKHTKSLRKGSKRLLIMDGHGSHHTAQFEAFCKEEGILTLCMPPHSSHLLQPLDVACFGPLK
jgi:hypothetical protein